MPSKRWILLAAFGAAVLGAVIRGLISGAHYAASGAVDGLFAVVVVGVLVWLIVLSARARRLWWIFPAVFGAVVGAVIGGVVGSALHTPDPNAYPDVGGAADAFWGGVLGLLIGVSACVLMMRAARSWPAERRQTHFVAREERQPR